MTHLPRLLLTAGLLAGAAMPAFTQTAKVDAEALARTAIAESRLPDKDARLQRKLAKAVQALPPWAPWYPGARLGMDSGSDAPGQVQVGFSTADSEDKVARFYLQRLRARGTPTDLKEAGVRTLEVSNADQSQITSVVLMPRSGGGVDGLLRHEGGGY